MAPGRSTPTTMPAPTCRSPQRWTSSRSSWSCPPLSTTSDMPSAWCLLRWRWLFSPTSSKLTSGLCSLPSLAFMYLCTTSPHTPPPCVFYILFRPTGSCVAFATPFTPICSSRTSCRPCSGYSCYLFRWVSLRCPALSPNYNRYVED